MRNLCCEMNFICIIIKNHFHINGFALSLALKVRFFGTRKWPIRQTWPRFRKRNKKSPSCGYLLHKASHQEILRQVQWQQRNVPKVSCTCRVVLLVKPVNFFVDLVAVAFAFVFTSLHEKCSVEFLNISTSIIRTPLYGGPFYGPSPPPNFLQCWPL